MRLRLLHNPTAGRGRARRKIDEAVKYLVARGANIDVVQTGSPEHLVAVAAKSSHEHWDVLVVCGGDGTLNLTIRELDLATVRLGIIPMGSGDDFAQTLGIPRDVHAACEVVLGGVVREVDVAMANGRRFLGVAGLGFDSQVARYANSVRRLKGNLVYLYSILRVLPQFKPHHVRVRADDEERQEEIMFAVVGNSPRYGAGIQIVPSAEVDDGILDLCMVRRCGIWNLLTTLPLAYSGKHVHRPYVIVQRGKRFGFASDDEELDVYADGELVARTPVAISLAPERLKVMVPRLATHP